MIKISNFFRAKIIKYVEYNGKTELYDITQELESVLDMLSTYFDGFDPAEVLIYMSEGNVKLMAVTKGF